MINGITNNFNSERRITTNYLWPTKGIMANQPISFKVGTPGRKLYASFMKWRPDSAETSVIYKLSTKQLPSITLESGIQD